MDYSIVVNALALTVYLGAFVVVAAVGGAVMAGVLRVATQIDDPSLGLAGRVAAVVFVLYLSAEHGFARVSEFAFQIWGNASFFY